jgi:hypothetical protein
MTALHWRLYRWLLFSLLLLRSILYCGGGRRSRSGGLDTGAAAEGCHDFLSEMGFWEERGVAERRLRTTYRGVTVALFSIVFRSGIVPSRSLVAATGRC